MGAISTLVGTGGVAISAAQVLVLVCPAVVGAIAYLFCDGATARVRNIQLHTTPCYWTDILVVGTSVVAWQPKKALHKGRHNQRAYYQGAQNSANNSEQLLTPINNFFGMCVE